MTKILILEDEGFIQELLAFVADDLGYKVIGPVDNEPAALSLIEECDCAILDVFLGRGENSFEVARQLKAMGKPFFFMSGAPIDNPEFINDMFVGKPATIGILTEAMIGLVQYARQALPKSDCIQT